MARTAGVCGFVLVVFVVFPAAVRAAGADKAGEAFRSLYGEEYQRATATPEKEDDVALARKLLGAAERAVMAPDFMALLCDRAFELASKVSAGYPTALAAMRRLAEEMPDREGDCREKTLDVCQRWYKTARGAARPEAAKALLEALIDLTETRTDAGDFDAALNLCRRALPLAKALRSDAAVAIQGRVEILTGRRQVERELAQQKARFKANPQDGAARDALLNLYLVELDDLEEATTYLAPDADEKTRRLILVATMNVERLPEAACLELGNWYRGLAKQAKYIGQRAMLIRSRDYYEAYLGKHPAQDLSHTTAALALKEVAAALAKLPGEAGEGEGWIDVLALVDVAKDRVAGHWEFKQGRFYGKWTDRYTRITLPVMPQGNYHLRFNVKYVSVGEASGLRLMLPVAGELPRVWIGREDARFGGVKKDAEVKREQRRPWSAPVAGEHHTFDVKVLLDGEKVEVSVSRDGRRHLLWEGSRKGLGTEPYPHGFGMPNRKALGLCVWEAEYEFRSIRLRMTSGEAKLLRPKDAS